jgi:polyhydroxyalkanoate synthesis regulator phasin
MNDWITTTNKLMDLANEYYYGAVNSILWGTEKSLALTKSIVAQVEANQHEGKKLLEDYTDRARRTQGIIQEVWQEGVKSTTTNMNALRVASDAAVVELDRKIESINEKLTSTGKKVSNN